MNFIFIITIISMYYHSHTYALYVNMTLIVHVHDSNIKNIVEFTQVFD